MVPMRVKNIPIIYVVVSFIFKPRVDIRLIVRIFLPKNVYFFGSIGILPGTLVQI
jgi:hypothetical protein